MKKIAFVTFITDDLQYVEMAAMMFYSLSKNGGPLVKNSSFHVIVSGEEKGDIDLLRTYFPNIHIHRIPNMFDELLVGSLLGFTQINYNADAVVYLDADIMVMGDLSEKIKECIELKTIGAAYAQHAPLTNEEWKGFSESLNIPIEFYSTGTHPLPYFNTGVLIYAHKLPLNQFGELWIKLTNVILSQFEKEPGFKENFRKRGYFSEQIGFTFAIKGLGILPHIITTNYHFRIDYIEKNRIPPDISSISQARLIHYVGSWWSPKYPFLPPYRTPAGDRWYAEEKNPAGQCFSVLLDSFYRDLKTKPLFEADQKTINDIDKNVESYKKDPKKYVKDKWQSVDTGNYTNLWFTDIEHNPARQRFYDYVINKTNNQHKTIMEIGCGTGHNLFELAKKIESPKLLLVGLDISHNMMTHIGPKELNGHKIVFIAADLEHIPLKEEADLVISFSVLEYFAPQTLGKALIEVINSTDKEFINFCMNYRQPTAQTTPQARVLSNSRVFNDRTQIISEHNYPQTFEQIKSQLNHPCKMEIIDQDIPQHNNTFIVSVTRN